MRNKINKLDFKQRGKLGLVGGFLLHTVLGSCYVWANLCEYVTAYFVQQQQEDITNKEVNIIFPILLLSFPIGLSQGTSLANKYGPKRISFIFTCFLSISIILSSLTTSFWVFVLFYGVFAGLSMGFIYMIPLDNAQKFFPNSKGAVYGVIICGYGLGSLIFNWILFYLINPQNIKAEWSEEHKEYLYPTEVSANLPSTLIAFGLIYFVIASIGSYLIIQPSEKDLLEVRASLISLQSLQQFCMKTSEVTLESRSDNKVKQKNQQIQQNIDNHEQFDKNTYKNKYKSEQNQYNKYQDGDNYNNQNEGQQDKRVITWQEIQMSAKEEYKAQKKREMMNDTEECQSLSVALKQKQLYLSIILASIGVCFGIIMASNYKSYGLAYHNDDKFFYIISTVSSLSNGLSRLFWGYLMDHMKFKKIIILNISIQIFLDITLWFIASNSFLYSLYICLTFFCYGGWYVIMPTHCYRLFGSKIASKIYCIISLGFPLSGVVQQILVKNFQWNNVFLIVFGLQAFGLVLANVSSLNINWREKSLLENIKKTIQNGNNNNQDQHHPTSQVKSFQITSPITQINPTINCSTESPVKKKQNTITKKDYYMMDYEI